MTFILTEEQQRLAGLARELGPAFEKRALAYDRAAEFPAENFKELKSAGLHKMTVPKRFGGHGLWQDGNYLAYYLVLKELARFCSSTAQLLQVHSHGVGIVAGLANDAQLARYMPDVAEGGHLYASCGSEASVRTLGPEKFDSIVKPAGDGFVLNGFKGFASVGPAADQLVIWALVTGKTKMEDGMVFAVVPRDRAGVRLENNWDTLGMRPTVSWNIHLTNVAVDASEIVGEPGDWVQKDPRTFTLGFASNHLGQAQAVYEFVKTYLLSRPDLKAGQVALTQLGDAEARITAAESVLFRAAELWERGDYHAAERVSMQTLYLAKQAGLDFATKAFDICGARATFNDQLLNLYYRDLRTFTLHFREDRLLQMLSQSALGEPFHSKLRYGQRIDRSRQAAE